MKSYRSSPRSPLIRRIPFPHISNLSFNLAVVVNDPQRGERFARVKVEDVLPRLVRIPDEDQAEQYMQRGLTEGLANTFVWMEEIIAAHLDMLFPGLHRGGGCIRFA